MVFDDKNKNIQADSGPNNIRGSNAILPRPKLDENGQSISVKP